jgi:hypothetical protein
MAGWHTNFKLEGPFVQEDFVFVLFSMLQIRSPAQSTLLRLLSTCSPDLCPPIYIYIYISINLYIYISISLYLYISISISIYLSI